MANVIKKLPLHVTRRSTKMLPIVVGLLIAGAFLQNVIDPTAKKYQVGQGNLAEASGGLNNEFLLLPLLGFREAAAGLLWVRCDEFFHSGDYDAILPLVRLITWLDPHSENVFVTGAWHLAYNFTDSSERSDRRYIAPSQALLDEGIKYNMNIPDIKFEKGWQNYDKIKDYVAAEKAFQMAIDGPKGDGKGIPGTDDYPYAAPLKTHHTLAHTYVKRGRIAEALAEWQRALVRSTEMLKVKPDDFAIKQMHSAEERNYKEILQRYYDRYTTKNHSTDINPTPYPAVLRPVGKTTEQRPWNTAFRPHIEVKRRQVFVVSGRLNTADGARVDVRITDWDYKEREIGATKNLFDVDQSQTILVDAISVKKNKFERELDMSKDPKMYSFTGDFYKVVLSFNPRGTSPHIQDRFGWSGEGMTDDNKNVVFVDKREPLMGNKLIEGQDGDGPVWDGVTIPWKQYGQAARLIKLTYKISRQQVMGQKPITDSDIVPNE